MRFRHAPLHSAITLLSTLACLAPPPDDLAPEPALTSAHHALLGADWSPEFQAPSCDDSFPHCDTGALVTKMGALETHSPNTINNSCTDGTQGTWLTDEAITRISVRSSSGDPIRTNSPITIEVEAYVWSTSMDTILVFYSDDANPDTFRLLAALSPALTGFQAYTIPAQTGPTPGTQAVRASIRYGSPSLAPCVGGGGMYNFDDTDDLAFRVDPPLHDRWASPPEGTLHPWSGRSRIGRLQLREHRKGSRRRSSRRRSSLRLRGANSLV